MRKRKMLSALVAGVMIASAILPAIPGGAPAITNAIAAS